MKSYWFSTIFILAASIAPAQDQGKKGGPSGPPLMMMIPAFKDGSDLPVKYSCSNAPAGVSPQIQWMNAPAATQSFAILLHDPEPHPAKEHLRRHALVHLEHSSYRERVAGGRPRGRSAGWGASAARGAIRRRPVTLGHARLPDRTITTRSSYMPWIRSSTWDRMQRAPTP